MASKPFDRKCRNCGTEFSTGDWRKRFCCQKCNWEWHNAQRPTTQQIERSCVVCGTKFKPEQKRGVGRKWCTEECRLTILRGYKPRKKQKVLDRKRWAREWQKKNRTPVKEKDRDLQRKFGITLEQYNEMLAAQNGVCALCGQPEKVIDKRSGKPRSLAVDHHHDTGKVRALLCMACNQGIGNMQESVAKLQKAVQYLQQHQGDLNELRTSA
jgi:hypothetical protein